MYKPLHQNVGLQITQVSKQLRNGTTVCLPIALTSTEMPNLLP